jgi:ATP-binding cassette subfamily F protein uup
VIVAEGGGRWTEYAGGYSDMVNQRGYGVIKPDAPVRAPKGDKVAPMAQIAPAKAKLSFKQKHALETLPTQIAKHEAEIARLNKLLADPGLYARDAKAFAEGSAKLVAAEKAKSKAEDEWLELEALRERIEG